MLSYHSLGSRRAPYAALKGVFFGAVGPAQEHLRSWRSEGPRRSHLEAGVSSTGTFLGGFVRSFSEARFGNRRTLPENAKGWGKKEGRGKTRGDTPHGKQFPTLLASAHFALPYSISVIQPLRNSQTFPQVTSPETAFCEGLHQHGFQLAILRFCLSIRFPPPPAMSMQGKKPVNGQIVL